MTESEIQVYVDAVDLQLKNITNNPSCLLVMSRMSDAVKHLRAENEKLKAENERLKERIRELKGVAEGR